MSKEKLEKRLEKLNDLIDEKILADKPYNEEALLHKKLVSILK